MIYRIPSIAEINALAGANGRTVISTFAGTGGSSTGYKMAGFDVRVAAEFIPEAADSYEANAPKTHVVRSDIRTIKGSDLLDLAGLARGDLDVLDGSPPCSAFSTAGLREDGWGVEKHYSGATNQRVDDLFFEFTRLIDEIDPKVIVAENVPGLISGVAQGYFKEIFAALEAAGRGYKVAARVLDASRLGVPQKRSRLLFVGVRKDLERDPVYPRPLPSKLTVTLSQAIADLPPPEPGTYSVLKPGTRTRMAWNYTDVLRDQGCFRHAYQRLYAKDARYMWFKLNPAKPCPTITAKIATLFRWDEPRTLSIAEIKRLSSFPDDFQLTGTTRQQWERVGRAVPPLMMGHLAAAIARGVFGWTDRSLVHQVVDNLRA
jgi:DNA (cytosine-5)-methyltransferase 1